jgi:hypothetical protein
MRKVFVLVICLIGICSGKKFHSENEPLCDAAIETFFQLLEKDYWAEGYEFLISAIILGDKTIYEHKTGTYCNNTETIQCGKLDFNITYKCPHRYIYVIDEFQRLESIGAPNSGKAGQPLGTK